MSLSAYWGDERISRELVTSANEKAVRETFRKGGRLTHPFCGHRAFLRSKPVGTSRLYHFVHETLRDGACAWSGESETHLALKDTIVHEARRLGWDAVAEAGRSGQSRADHVPDVLATDPSTGRRVVFEAQLSSQAAELSRERHAVRVRVPETTALWLTPSVAAAKHAGWVPIYTLSEDRTKASASPGGAPVLSIEEWVQRALAGTLALPPSRKEKEAKAYEEDRGAFEQTAFPTWFKTQFPQARKSNARTDRTSEQDPGGEPK